MLQETKKKLDRIADWIWRERRINRSVDVVKGMKELQVDLEKCSKCFRPAGPTGVPQLGGCRGCNTPPMFYASGHPCCITISDEMSNSSCFFTSFEFFHLIKFPICEVI
jgi:hypothetical protein